MPGPISLTAGTLFVAKLIAGGALTEVGRRGMSYAYDNAEDIQKTVKEEIDKGWERDCEAGGITSIVEQPQTELA